MIVRKIFGAAILAAACSTGLSAQAQALPGLNTSAILAECEIGSENCALLIQQALAQLQAAQLPDAEHAAAIAELSKLVVEAAQNTSSSTELHADLLGDIAAAARDEEQAAAIQTVAVVVEQGAADDVQVESLDASPA